MDYIQLLTYLDSREINTALNKQLVGAIEKSPAKKAEELASALTAASVAYDKVKVHAPSLTFIDFCKGLGIDLPTSSKTNTNTK
jgi:hypothetical protein